MLLPMVTQKIQILRVWGKCYYQWLHKKYRFCVFGVNVTTNGCTKNTDFACLGYMYYLMIAQKTHILRVSD